MLACPRIGYQVSWQQLVPPLSQRYALLYIEKLYFLFYRTHVRLLPAISAARHTSSGLPEESVSFFLFDDYKTIILRAAYLLRSIQCRSEEHTSELQSRENLV